jgi:hypothetical protein
MGADCPKPDVLADESGVVPSDFGHGRPPGAALAAKARRLEHSIVPRNEMKLEEREFGVLAFVDESGRVWAQCAKPSPIPADPDYVVEGPLSGFVNEEGSFTTESEQEFRAWLDDRLISDDLFYVSDKETALSIAQRIAEAACRILKDRPR